MYLVRTDAGGNLQWYTTYGGSASDVANAVANTADGGYVVAGHTLSSGAGLHDAWAIRLAPEGPSAVPPPATAPGLFMDVRPNPFFQSAAIRYVAPGASKLWIHDANGRLVRTIHEGNSASGAHTILWDGRDGAGRRVAPGVYYCRVLGEDLRSVVKVVRVGQ